MSGERVSGAPDALFWFSIISKAGLEKFEDFSRPALFLETYVTASHFKVKHDIERLLD